MPVLGVQSHEAVLMPVLGHSLVFRLSAWSSALHIMPVLGVQSHEAVLMPVLGHSLVFAVSLELRFAHNACIGCAKP